MDIILFSIFLLPPIIIILVLVENWNDIKIRLKDSREKFMLNRVRKTGDFIPLMRYIKKEKKRIEKEKEPYHRCCLTIWTLYYLKLPEDNKIALFIYNNLFRERLIKEKGIDFAKALYYDTENFSKLMKVIILKSNDKNELDSTDLDALYNLLDQGQEVKGFVNNFEFICKRLNKKWYKKYISPYKKARKLGVPVLELLNKGCEIQQPTTKVVGFHAQDFLL